MYATYSSSTRRPRDPDRLELERLEDRLLMTGSCSTYFDPSGTLKIYGDRGNNAIVIHDSGQGEVEVTCDGKTKSFHEVHEIQAFTGGGDDKLKYSLDGDLYGYDRRLYFDLGSGKDEAEISAEDVRLTNNLSVSVYGGSGKDKRNVELHDVVLDHWAYVDVDVDGGSGDDKIKGEFTAPSEGWGYYVDFWLNGGSGNDKVSFESEIEGFGWPDTLRAYLYGGYGNDELKLEVDIKDPWYSGYSVNVDLYVDGGYGWDTAEGCVEEGGYDHSPYVPVYNVEELKFCEDHDHDDHSGDQHVDQTF